MDLKKALAISAATADELNDQNTIVLSVLASAIRQIGPSPLLLDLLAAQDAARDMAWSAAMLLDFARRNGARPSAARAETMIAEWRLDERETRRCNL